MQVNLETLGQLERRLNIVVPFAQIDAEVNSRLKRVSRTAKIQGFRPGKAPLRIVEQFYGPQVREEVLGETVQRSFSQAVTEQQLRVAGYPRFEPLPAEGDTTDFKFSAVFEVYPEIAVGDLSAVDLENPVTDVTDAEVDKTIDILRKQRTSFNAVERAAQENDRVIIDFAGKIDGEVFEGGKADNYSVWLGQGQMLKDFEAGIVGVKEGESKTFEMVFPEDYHGKDVAGKTVVWEITVKNVAEATLPELNDDFAKMLGIEDGDLTKMRDEVKKNVQREVSRRLKARLKEGVMQALLDNTKFDVPKALVQMEVGRLQQQTANDFASRGIDVANMQLPAELFTAQAERRVSLGLILAELVKHHNLQAKPEQIRVIVEEFAESYEQPEDVVKWYYASRERLEGPEALATEDNVVEWAKTQAKVQDKALSFDELMGNK
ncbi:trigger factor [Chitinivorax tropicus]|uniref:Trigger factor n=1 Tax=Chitinivorax tropicus TaxID=714531 RepID=A0A840MKS1_9PROT|nr:trigger factor [Chitinivorax tropicus]MBB5017739.1 trigger factor [Chitinivorax tropicus]